MRKDLQLCAQAARAIDLHLLEIEDDALIGLHLLEVTPAPDATRLRVVLGIEADATGSAPLVDRIAAARAALSRHEPRLREIVAAAITRKRAPMLCYFFATARRGVDA